jgi:hypothetical protein
VPSWDGGIEHGCCRCGVALWMARVLTSDVGAVARLNTPGRGLALLG